MFRISIKLSSEKVSPDSEITYVLDVMVFIGISVQINTGNSLAYTSSKIKQFFAYDSIKHITDIPVHATT